MLDVKVKTIDGRDRSFSVPDHVSHFILNASLNKNYSRTASTMFR